MCLGNLYIVATPLNADGSHTEMEDFFAPEAKTIILGGKTFDPKSDGKSEKTYGKAIFSTQVVESGHYNIGFGGFQTTSRSHRTRRRLSPTNAAKPRRGLLASSV
jgi:hypothetical protein